MIAKVKRISLTRAEFEINKLLGQGKTLQQILYPRKSEMVPVQEHSEVEVDDNLSVKISVKPRSQYREWRRNLVGDLV